jgi:mannose-6-phosphate isomerase-like protein (cupin superfamily)
VDAEPIIAQAAERIAASGARVAVHEWRHGEGGGPALHTHHDDDEAWHVLAGVLRFRFAERTFDASAGATVFVPAGVAHTFHNPGPGEARYLIITTPRVLALIDALHSQLATTPEAIADIWLRHRSEIVE